MNPRFIISVPKWQDCPAPDKPEYAFIGRSNVGKSSLINMLTERKGLAKTSAKPGKTQLINMFLIQDSWYLTDLPGYGYAKVSKKQRGSFQKMITDYLKNRTNLVSIFVLIDSRIPPQKIDLEFMQWLGENQIPFSMVFTKTDKISETALKKGLEIYKNTMLKDWEFLPQIFITSALNNTGREDLLNFITSLNVQLEDDFSNL